MQQNIFLDKMHQDIFQNKMQLNFVLDKISLHIRSNKISVWIGCTKIKGRHPNFFGGNLTYVATSCSSVTYFLSSPVLQSLLPVLNFSGFVSFISHLSRPSNRVTWWMSMFVYISKGVVTCWRAWKSRSQARLALSTACSRATSPASCQRSALDLPDCSRLTWDRNTLLVILLRSWHLQVGCLQRPVNGCVDELQKLCSPDHTKVVIALPWSSAHLPRPWLLVVVKLAAG